MKGWFSNLSHAIPKPRTVAFADARGTKVRLTPAVPPSAVGVAHYGTASPSSCMRCGYHQCACSRAPAPVAKAVVTGLKVTIDDDIPITAAPASVGCAPAGTAVKMGEWTREPRGFPTLEECKADAEAWLQGAP